MDGSCRVMLRCMDPALDTHLLLNLWIVLGLAALAHVLLLAG
jgi:hypothetical protein